MSKLPNIVLIMTDQQRYDTIGALGFPHVDTPHLDRLVEAGVSFDRCYVNAPSCVPSRASLFTGFYPHTTGVLKNGDAWEPTWLKRLAECGYRTVNVGKMHTQPFDAPGGFHERYIVENKDRPEGPYHFYDDWERALIQRGLAKPTRASYAQRSDFAERLGAFAWSLPEDLHPDVYVGHVACWWLERYRGEKPFFLQVGFPGPHPPYDPVGRYVAPYRKRDLPLAPVIEAELTAQPPPYHALRTEHLTKDHDACRHLPNPTPEQRHRQRAHYLANVTMIDEQVGRILQALQRHGDETIVVFTSDHGDCLTDHGHSQKWTMYEQVVRVPLIFWRPAGFSAGSRVTQLVQLFDVGPTLLELAGIEPDATETISLAPALTGGPFAGRPAVFAEHGPDNLLREVSLMTMVRTAEAKLVHFHGQAYGQLFDLRADPDERRNLWDVAAYQATKQGLLDTQREWLIESNLRRRSVSAHNPLTPGRRTRPSPGEHLRQFPDNLGAAASNRRNAP